MRWNVDRKTTWPDNDGRGNDETNRADLDNLHPLGVPASSDGDSGW